MNINIYGKSIKITDGIKDAIYCSFQKLEPFITGTYSITLDVRHGDHIADAIVHVPGSSDIHASSSHSDMYTAIDILSDKMKSQLEKNRSKQKNIDRSVISDMIEVEE